MPKNMRSKLTEDEYSDFGVVQSKLQADTNGETVSQLVDFYNEVDSLLEGVDTESDEPVEALEEIVDDFKTED